MNIEIKRREFAKLKRFVSKRFPGAHTIKNSDGSFKVLDGKGYSIVSEELRLPPSYDVMDAWEKAKYSAWFTKMIARSNKAFSDDKILKKLAKKDKS